MENTKHPVYPEDMRGAVRDWLADNNYQDGGEYAENQGYH